ncbi:class II histone deacetylase complex subunits 2 and 3-domain-containing protein [Dipodascopsis uninucleata]
METPNGESEGSVSIATNDNILSVNDSDIGGSLSSPEPGQTDKSNTETHHANSMSLTSGVAKLPDDNVVDSALMLDKYRLGPFEYAVPVGLFDFQRQIYEQVIILHSSEILRFCDFVSSPASLREQLEPAMRTVANRTMLAATHPYLLVPSLLPRNLNDKEESRYIAAIGEKFHVLESIVMAFKQTGLKLGIVAREGPTMDLVSTFLSGKKIKYARREGEMDMEVNREMTEDESQLFEKAIVVLVPSTAKDENDKNKRFILPAVDLVVALDSSFDASQSQVQQLRGATGAGLAAIESLAPVIRLVAVNTCEHALVGAAASLGSQDIVLDISVLSSVITAVTLLRQDAGRLPEEVRKELDVLPQKLPAWIKDKRSEPFPFSFTMSPNSTSKILSNLSSSMVTVKEINLRDVLSESASGSLMSEMLNSLESDSHPPIQISIEDAILHFLKMSKLVGVADDSPETKRLRLSDIEGPGNYMQLDSKEDELEEDDDHLKDNYLSDNDEDLSSLSVDVKEQIIESLRLHLTDAHARVHLLESELDNFKEHHVTLLLKDENTDKIMQELVARNEELEKRVTTAQKRIEQNDVEKARLKSEIAEKKVLLEKAENALLNGSADLKELQELRNTKSKLEDDNRRLQNTLQNHDSTANYMRIEYEKATRAAREAEEEIQKQKQINQELERKANVNVQQLKLLQWDAERSEWEANIAKYKLRIESLEESLKRLQVDRTARGGRYGIRSSSVPRRGLSPATV